MRKYLIPLLAVFAAFMTLGLAYAADLPTTEHMVAVPDFVAPPDWLLGILDYLRLKVPVVGVVLVKVEMWAGVAIVIMTNLAACLVGIQKGLEKLSQVSPYFQWMQKVADALDLVIPWLKWASALNHPQPWKKE